MHELKVTVVITRSAFMEREKKGGMATCQDVLVLLDVCLSRKKGVIINKSIIIDSTKNVGILFDPTFCGCSDVPAPPL